MARPIDIKVTLDLPDGVEFPGTERVGDGHGIEVKVPLPDVCPCEARGRKDWATYEDRNTVYTARYLDLCGQPCASSCSSRVGKDLPGSFFAAKEERWREGILSPTSKCKPSVIAAREQNLDIRLPVCRTMRGTFTFSRG